MSTAEKILKVLEGLPEIRKHELLDFARYLYWLERQAKENFAIDVLADIVRKLRPTYYDSRSIVEKFMKS